MLTSSKSALNLFFIAIITMQISVRAADCEPLEVYSTYNIYKQTASYSDLILLSDFDNSIFIIKPERKIETLNVLTSEITNLCRLNEKASGSKSNSSFIVVENKIIYVERSDLNKQVIKIIDKLTGNCDVILTDKEPVGKLKYLGENLIASLYWRAHNKFILKVWDYITEELIFKTTDTANLYDIDANKIFRVNNIICAYSDRQFLSWDLSTGLKRSSKHLDAKNRKIMFMDSLSKDTITICYNLRTKENFYGKKNVDFYIKNINIATGESKLLAKFKDFEAETIKQLPNNILACIPKRGIFMEPEAKIKIYDTMREKLISNIEHNQNQITALEYIGNNKVAIGFCTGTIKVFDVYSGLCTHKLANEGCDPEIITISTGKFISKSSHHPNSNNYIIKFWDIPMN